MTNLYGLALRVLVRVKKMCVVSKLSIKTAKLKKMSLLLQTPLSYCMVSCLFVQPCIYFCVIICVYVCTCLDISVKPIISEKRMVTASYS
jgi:hypothetical protein